MQLKKKKIKIWTEDLNRYISKEDMQLANKHMEQCLGINLSDQIRSDQSLSRVQLFATP